jgi:hypothetical protein
MGEYIGNKWAATHESELAQFEANLAEHFGEEQYDEGKYETLTCYKTISVFVFKQCSYYFKEKLIY